MSKTKCFFLFSLRITIFGEFKSDRTQKFRSFNFVSPFRAHSIELMDEHGFLCCQSTTDANGIVACRDFCGQDSF